MTPLQTRTAWGLVVATVAAVAFAPPLTGQEESKKPHQLLSVNTVLYFSQDGSVEHAAAWEKTAAHDALYKSGLMGVLDQLLVFAKQQVPPGQGTEAMEIGFKHISEHGFTGGVSMTRAGMPSATLVLHDAAGMTQPFVTFLNTNVAPQANVWLEEKEVGGQKIHVAEIPDTPGIELAIMSAGGHMTVSVGTNASVSAVAVAKGEQPSLSENDVWKKYNHSTASADSETTTVAWFDMKRVGTAYARFPVPETQSRVEDFLKALGLHNVETLAMHSGYKGRAIWSEGHVDVNGERTGLLAMGSDKSMKLSDLPPLPADTQGFSATRLDMANVWDTVFKVAKDVTDIGPPELEGQVDEAREQVERAIGLNLKSALLEPLGDICCVYTDPEQGIMGLGSGAAVSLGDAGKLRLAIKKLVDVVREASGGEFDIRRTTKQGRELITFRFANRAEAGCIMIDEKWMVMALMPQTCEAFALRMDGKLPAWKPSEEQTAALAELPKEFTSISVGDPRLAWGRC